MRRVIFHIDVNSAFLSWTAVKLLEEGEEDIRLVPSVVSGDPSDRRSIVTAASIPAKKNGNKDSPAGDNGPAHMPESQNREGRLGLVQAVLGLIYGYMQELLPGAGKVLH